MRINPISTIALIGGLAIYANAILERAHISGPVDPRIDVLVIAALGVLAHFAFERAPKPAQ
jgi:hypothetical protein